MALPNLRYPGLGSNLPFDPSQLPLSSGPAGTVPRGRSPNPLGVSSPTGAGGRSPTGSTGITGAGRSSNPLGGSSPLDTSGRPATGPGRQVPTPGSMAGTRPSYGPGTQGTPRAGLPIQTGPGNIFSGSLSGAGQPTYTPPGNVQFGAGGYSQPAAGQPTQATQTGTERDYATSGARSLQLSWNEYNQWVQAGRPNLNTYARANRLGRFAQAARPPTPPAASTTPAPPAVTTAPAVATAPQRLNWAKHPEVSGLSASEKLGFRRWLESKYGAGKIPYMTSEELQTNLSNWQAPTGAAPAAPPITEVPTAPAAAPAETAPLPSFDREAYAAQRAAEAKARADEANALKQRQDSERAYITSGAKSLGLTQQEYEDWVSQGSQGNLRSYRDLLRGQVAPAAAPVAPSTAVSPPISSPAASSPPSAPVNAPEKPQSWARFPEIGNLTTPQQLQFRQFLEGQVGSKTIPHMTSGDFQNYFKTWQTLQAAAAAPSTFEEIPSTEAIPNTEDPFNGATGAQNQGLVEATPQFSNVEAAPQFDIGSQISAQMAVPEELPEELPSDTLEIPSAPPVPPPEAPSPSELVDAPLVNIEDEMRRQDLPPGVFPPPPLPGYEESYPDPSVGTAATAANDITLVNQPATATTATGDTTSIYDVVPGANRGNIPQADLSGLVKGSPFATFGGFQPGQPQDTGYDETKANQMWEDITSQLGQPPGGQDRWDEIMQQWQRSGENIGDIAAAGESQASRRASELAKGAAFGGGAMSGMAQAALTGARERQALEMAHQQRGTELMRARQGQEFQVAQDRMRQGLEMKMTFLQNEWQKAAASGDKQHERDMFEAMKSLRQQLALIEQGVFPEGTELPSGYGGPADLDGDGYVSADEQMAFNEMSVEEQAAAAKEAEDAFWNKLKKAATYASAVTPLAWAPALASYTKEPIEDLWNWL